MLASLVNQVKCMCVVCVCDMCVHSVCVSLYTAIVFVAIENKSSRQLLGHFPGLIPISIGNYVDEFPLHPA